jgi:glycosyltransferase involved in cell wall biosynthesis
MIAEHPRATFVLLGYNNERFVDAAIAGAFGQTYRNLEIFLSDDCSSDSTFQKMERAAASYPGPHSVKLNRTAANRGTLAHIYEVAARVTGDLVVLAAADDVSYPDRVEVLVQAWQETGAQALFSSQDLIDEEGQVLARKHKHDDSALEWKDYFPDARLIRGATSAYAHSTFAEIRAPKARILFEDTFFTLMLHLRGSSIAFVDRPLVQYRVHADATTNADFAHMGSAEIIERERRTQVYAESIVAILDEFESNLGSHPAPANLASDRSFYDFRTRWMDTSFGQRFRALLLAQRRQHRRWLAARLFGPSVLAWVKASSKVGPHQSVDTR